MKSFLTVMAVITFLGLAALYEFKLWQECRATHSWMYCTRVLVP